MDNHLTLAKRPSLCIIVFIMICLPSVLLAEMITNLPDPTRPNMKRERNIVKAIASAKPAAVLALQSTLIAPNRCLAVINGKTFYVGGRIGGGEIVDIAPHQVTIVRSGIREILRLLPEQTTQYKQLLRGTSNDSRP